MTAILTLALCLLPAQQAPPVRPTETVDISGGSGYGQLAVASGGEYSGVMWLSDHLNAGRFGVYVSPAGGRGVGFGSPVRIDADPNDAQAQLRPDSLQVAGRGIYALWIDLRDQNPGSSGIESDLWFASSHDAGASWRPERWLDKGHPAGFGQVAEFRFAADDHGSADPGDDLLAIALVAIHPSGQGSAVRFLRSNDGGTSWSAPLDLSARGGPDLRMSLDGPHVHLAWSEWRGNSPEVFYQRSDDGGRHWLPQPLGLTPGQTDVIPGALALDGSGPTVAVAWTQRAGGGFAPALTARLSGDGGRHFGPPSVIGNYPLGSASVRDPDLIVHRGTVVATWADNRASTGRDNYQAFVAATRDLGHTWFETLISTAGEGRAPRFADAGPDAGHLVLAYTTDQVQGQVECATSRDGGLHWTPGFQVSGRPDLVLESRVAWNERYDNAVVAWLGINSIQRIHSYAGGFRPQCVRSGGFFYPGGIAWFEVEGFPVADEGALFGVLVSGGEGDWRYNSKARDTGLMGDGVLAASLGMIPGQLSGTIRPGGIGQTAAMTIPASMPSGKTLYYAAMALRLPSASAAMTDVGSLTLN